MNARYKKFVREYVKIIAEAGVANGRQAALNAGYSPKSATAQASQLLTRPDVKAYLDELQVGMVAKTKEEESEALDNIDKSKQVAADQIAQIMAELEALEIPEGLQKRADGMELTTTKVEEYIGEDGEIVGNRKRSTEIKEIAPDVQALTVILETKNRLRRQLQKWMDFERLLNGGVENKGQINIYIEKQDLHL
jgi:phage terminase small subunit